MQVWQHTPWISSIDMFAQRLFPECGGLSAPTSRPLDLWLMKKKQMGLEGH